MKKQMVGLVLVLGTILCAPEVGAEVNFQVTPASLPNHPTMAKWSTYTEQTKHHYMLRSYLEKIEEAGGGTLTLAKGTYDLPMKIAIPSNTTLILEDGVTLEKTNDTGTPLVKPTTSVIEVVAPSVVSGGKKVGGYEGSQNVKIIGKGSATIDLNGIARSSALAIAHNRNLLLKGITIKDQYGSHAIELDATKDALIEDMKFLGSKAIPNTGPNESINLDTPDPVTGGFLWKWSAQDRTPNENVIIRNNIFKNVNVAIGTHQYSDDRPHKKIRIENNVINGTKDHAIFLMNWSYPVIKKNDIRNVHRMDGKAIAVYGRGVVRPIIENNTITDADRAIQFQPYQQPGFKALKNVLTKSDTERLRKNSVRKVKENQIILYQKLNIFTMKTSVRLNFNK